MLARFLPRLTVNVSPLLFPGRYPAVNVQFLTSYWPGQNSWLVSFPLLLLGKTGSDGKNMIVNASELPLMTGPEIFSVSSVPSVPSVPSVLSVPSVPSFLSVPSVPSVYGVLSVPSVPSVLSVLRVLNIFSVLNVLSVAFALSFDTVDMQFFMANKITE